MHEVREVAMTSLEKDLARAISEVRACCKSASREGLMCGWNGNASQRPGMAPDQIVITRQGTAKGFLGHDDCLLVNLNGEILMGQGRPSSEMAVHLAIYAAVPECAAILHTHPAYMQALDITAAGALPLYEAQVWRQRLFFADDFPPGSRELAQAAAMALPLRPDLPCAVWLKRHGLFSLAISLRDALCLTEELEHLAKVELLASRR